MIMYLYSTLLKVYNLLTFNSFLLCGVVFTMRSLEEIDIEVSKMETKIHALEDARKEYVSANENEKRAMWEKIEDHKHDTNKSLDKLSGEVTKLSDSVHEANDTINTTFTKLTNTIDKRETAINIYLSIVKWVFGIIGSALAVLLIWYVAKSAGIE